MRSQHPLSASGCGCTALAAASKSLAPHGVIWNAVQMIGLRTSESAHIYTIHKYRTTNPLLNSIYIYCSWKTSCTSSWVVYPTIHMILYIQDGCRISSTSIHGCKSCANEAALDFLVLLNPLEIVPDVSAARQPVLLPRQKPVGEPWGNG